MTNLAQQIRNELRIARQHQKNAEYNAHHRPFHPSGNSDLARGYYDGRARALQDRRLVLGYLYLSLRKETQP